MGRGGDEDVGVAGDKVGKGQAVVVEPTARGRGDGIGAGGGGEGA